MATSDASCPGRHGWLGDRGVNESRQHQADKNDVHLLPEELHEKVAKFHLPAFGAALIVFTQEHADYAGVNVEGP